MSSPAADTKLVVNLAGVGAIAYLVVSALDVQKKLQDDATSFLQKVKDAPLAEDAAEGYFAAWDIQNRILTLGLADTTWAADFYAWLHNLTPEQQQAVQDAEQNGGLQQTADTTGKQLGDAASTVGKDLAAGMSVATRYVLAGLIGYGLILFNTSPLAAAEGK